jgi:pyruvate/2-oxoglutarate dehydrogenase complex dihydrolipoamide acyltransferase (E2) component
MALIDIQVPDIGDFDEVTVIELLVKPGDTVKAEQSLITVESDKASMEIPSSHAGVVKELRIKLGDKVKQGWCWTARALRQPRPPYLPRPLLPPWPAPLPSLRAKRGNPAHKPQPQPQPLLHPQPHPSAARPTSSAMCSCWAVVPAVTRRHSARLTSA